MLALLFYAIPRADAASDRHGNVRLVLDGSDLRLIVTDGDGLVVNGNIRRIPSSGPTLSSVGLSANTTYYIYVTWNGTSVTLEASTTGHAQDTSGANMGVRIKLGDANRTLVGMARTNASAQWVDSQIQRLVASYFNRRTRTLYTINPNAVSTSSSETPPTNNFVELDTTNLRLHFLTWADEDITCHAFGSARNPNAGWAFWTNLGIDDATPRAPIAYNQPGGQADVINDSVHYAGAVSEGYHFCTMLGQSSGGYTSTWFGGRHGMMMTIRQ